MPAKPKLAHPLSALSPHIAVLLSGIKGNKEQREQVDEGLYAVTTTLRITSTLAVGADYESQQVNKLEPWTLIALLLDKLPAVKIDDIVAEAAALATLKEQESDLDDRVDAMKERAQHVLDSIKPAAADALTAIKGATMQRKKGPVKIETLSVTVVNEVIEKAHPDFPAEKRPIKQS